MVVEIGLVSQVATSAKLGLFVQQSSIRLLTTDYPLLSFGFVSPSGVPPLGLTRRIDHPNSHCICDPLFDVSAIKIVL